MKMDEMYSRVSNKRRPTFINFWSFFQGLRSYLGGLHLLIFTKTTHKSEKQTQNEGFMKSFAKIVKIYLKNFPGPTFIWEPTLIVFAKFS